VLGRVVRTRRQVVACTVDKYEFRTQARAPQLVAPPADFALRRWAMGGEREMSAKTAIGG